MRLAATLATFAAFVAATAGAQPVITPTLITLSAEARIERAPDLAEMNAGVVTAAPTAGEASRANAVQMAQVIAAARKAGVVERDIRTSGLSLQPQYDYEDRRAPKLTGYQATNTVALRLRDLTRAGAVIDALVASGANQVTGPDFRIEEADVALDTARAAAVAKARARAELYARALGSRVRRVVSLTEGGGERPPMPVMGRMMAMEASSAPTPVQPGEIALAVSVTLVVEID